MFDLDRNAPSVLSSIARLGGCALRRGLTAGMLCALLATGSHAMCDPQSEADSADIAAARAAVAAACDCSGASTHGSYVKCAVQTANETLVNRSCAKYVKTCASHSTCGKPGFVSCCIPTGSGTKCKASKDIDRCTAKGGIASECTSCCDACPAPGAGLSCSVPPSTTTTLTEPTTTTTPPTTTLP